MEDKKYFQELFNFSCILQGEVKHLEKIKKYIIQEYVKKGLIKLIKPTYNKEEIHILTSDQWEEYQRLLKNKKDGLIGWVE